MSKAIFYIFLLLPLLFSCSGTRSGTAARLSPDIVTEPVRHDTDDPAIWIHPTNPALSLIIGTDKDADGGLYAYDLQGKIIRSFTPLNRPNNVDIAYGITAGDVRMDIAVVTERYTNKIRIFSLPGLQPVDNGGIEVFTGEQQRDPMGIALYTRPADQAIFAIVGRKSGPSGSYLWQYALQGNANGTVSATLVRKFGQYSGSKEIEAIAVDNELGYVYCADEGRGIRKYYADPARNDNRELAFFGTTGFKDDHEGISIYPTGSGTGYILISNQQANTFMVYPREGSATDAHSHELIAEVPVSTLESDGSEVTAVHLNDMFPQGVFVAMSNGRVFHYYDWRKIQAVINSAAKK